jgi:DNA-binding beta-propeller fold protein YncE
MHPLAESAGGDFIANGGKHWGSQNDAEWLTIKAWVMGENSPAPPNATRGSFRPTAPATTHIIDPATNKVVGIILRIEAGHGVGAAPDGSRIYISDEAEHSDIVDEIAGD